MKKQLSLLLMLISIIVILLPAVPCLAASAKVNITSDNTQVTAGDAVYVYIKINSGTTFGDFEADLTYDKDVLDYQGGASVITGGSGYLKISDMGNEQLDTSRKYALEFKARKVGTCEIAFSGQVMVYDDSGIEMPVATDSITIKVNAPQTASTNVNLKSLVTSPEDITPVFDKNVYEYSVNLSHETEKLIVTAIPEDDKANVSISGNDFLQDGENKIVITVLAESGDIIKYTIKAIRETAPTVTTLPTPSPIPDQSLAGFEILQTHGDIYALYNGKLKLITPESSVEVPTGYSKSKLTISGVTITAFIPEDNLNSEFVLLYAEDASGKADFYQFDRTQNTLQRYRPATNMNDKYRTDMNKAAQTIAILSALCVLLLIIAGWLFVKRRSAGRRDPE